MKIYKIIAIISLICLMCIVTCACNDEPVEDTVEYVNVTLDYNDGTPQHVVKVESGKHMTRPKDPTREGYTFGGWKSNGKEWNFEEYAFVNDVTLTATWINASSLFEYTLSEEGSVTLLEYSGSLKIVNIPDTISGNTVSALGDYLFSALDNRTPSQISVPASVTTIGHSAFSGVSDSSITILGAIESLGENAFSGCKGLRSIALGDSLSFIPYNAFGDSGLATADIPESVSVIDENAFFGCTELKTIVLPAGVEIRNAAFSGCNSLVTVFFLGSEAEWQEVLDKLDNGGGENNAILNARVMFYSKDEPEGEGDFWYRNKDGEPRGW